MGHPTVDCENCGLVFYLGELMRVLVPDEDAGYPNGQIVDLCDKCRIEMKAEEI
ncbi:hypothetical protein LCGC14_0873300 [marine sediment metagenome]|uniref:Uncharacterized protein n=1 Tax=marine sediment metagenome TaxID=412755 RepID=A0A0F9PPQ2_9ZZZZ